MSASEYMELCFMLEPGTVIQADASDPPVLRIGQSGARITLHMPDAETVRRMAMVLMQLAAAMDAELPTVTA